MRLWWCGAQYGSTLKKMMISRRLLLLVLCASLLSMSAAASGTTPIQIEVIPPAGESKEVGDVVVTWDDGSREPLTRSAHAEQAKLGPDGLIGWTWAKERYENLWVNEHLRVQRGKQLLFEVKSGKPFIEDWAFAAEGLVVKSRGAHGPAWIELLSVSNGKQIQVIKEAYGDDLPPWAKPFAD
jgi:hypothetical protein